MYLFSCFCRLGGWFCKGPVGLQDEGLAAVETGEPAVDSRLPDLAVPEDIDDTVDEWIRELDLQQITPHHGSEGMISATVVRDKGEKFEHPVLLRAKHAIEDACDLRRMLVVEMQEPLAGLHPVAAHERMGEEIGLSGYLPGGAELKAVQVVCEQLADLVMAVKVVAAEVDPGAEVAEVMVAEKQGDIVWVGVLEGKDLTEVVKGIVIGDSFIAVRVEVVSQKHDVAVLFVSDGLLPEGAAVDVWYDDHSYSLGFV